MHALIEIEWQRGTEDLCAQSNLGRAVRALPCNVFWWALCGVQPDRDRDTTVESCSVLGNARMAVHWPHSKRIVSSTFDRGAWPSRSLHTRWPQARMRECPRAQRRDRQRVCVAEARGPVHGSRVET